MTSGILNIYKEKGYTSHDVVARIRGITREKKVGHTGTLDPEAEGVLPVCLGRATKVCDLLSDKKKTYETTLLLGIDTDTQDLTGTVLSQNDISPLTDEEVRQVIQSYVGEYEQLSPMYSARKVQGKKLYEYARQGIDVERKAKKVQIDQITIRQIRLPRVDMEVTCSSGTYIRTLCHDIGADLKVGGCMESLLRTRVDRFTLSDSLTLDQVEQTVKEGRLNEILLPVDQLFDAYRQVTLSEGNEKNAVNGCSFSGKTLKDLIKFNDNEPVRVYDSGGRFIGLFLYHQEGEYFSVEKMFLEVSS